jgi:hypothetical protein
MNWTRCTIAAVVITLGFGIPGCRSCNPIGPMPKRGPVKEPGAPSESASALGVSTAGCFGGLRSLKKFDRILAGEETCQNRWISLNPVPNLERH